MADDFTPNGAERARQRSLILEALRLGPLNTIQAREAMGIAHPAGRVLELRKLGHRIVTKRRTVHDAAGRPHVSAWYVLIGEAAP
jgi:hypothetical protein